MALPALGSGLFYLHVALCWLAVLVWAVCLGYILLASFDYTEGYALTGGLVVMGMSLLNYIVFLIMVAKIGNAANRIQEATPAIKSA